MKLSAMRQLLAERGIQLTRSLGQNFLHDAHQLDRLIALADIRPGDRVLEIGPGLGPLTEHLLAAGARVLAIEKDARLVSVLRERFPDAATVPRDTGETSAPPDNGSTSRLSLVEADALAWLRRENRDWRGWKLVANLPYSVASPLLVDLTQPETGPDQIVVTLQLEVIHRLTAAPGSKDYGILTLLVQLGYEPTGSFKISRSCFFPEPDVDSGGLALRRRPSPELSSSEARVFRRIVKRAFSERRKKALKLLRFDWPTEVVTGAWSDLELAEDLRAERVTRAQYIELARRLAPVDAQSRP
ncbi:MAG: ribosomal RNA small subunit methyltransferase A [Verrucomicrobiales bacterium]|nr:ribosomal RNA small subunit methyltransferase A [Verrucomicrobiales bacterium]